MKAVYCEEVTLRTGSISWARSEQAPIMHEDKPNIGTGLAVLKNTKEIYFKRINETYTGQTSS